MSIHLDRKAVLEETATSNSNNEFPVCNMTQEAVRNSPVVTREYAELTMEEYYAIGDSVSSLERLRQYQWRDFLGRYKIF